MVRRQLHRRESKREKGGGTISVSKSRVPPQIKSKIDEYVEYALENRISPDEFKTELKKLAKELQIAGKKSPAWTYVMTLSRTYPKMLKERLEKEGEKPEMEIIQLTKKRGIIDILIDSGVVTEEKIIEKYKDIKRRAYARGRQLKEKDVYNQIRIWLNQLAQKRRIKKEIKSIETVASWLKQHLPKEERKRAEGELVFNSRKEFIDEDINPLWKTFKENVKVEPGTLNDYRTYLGAFWEYMTKVKNKPNVYSWTIEDARDFIYWIYDTQAYASGRSFITPLRHFYVHCLGFDINEVYKKIAVKAFEKKYVKKPIAEDIHYWRPSEIDKMISYIPDKTITFEVAGKERKVKSSPYLKKMYTALLRLLACTGARQGSEPETAEWFSILEAPNLENLKKRLFTEYSGSISIRLQDLAINDSVKVLKEVKRDGKIYKEPVVVAKTWTIKIINEKKGETWKNIPLTTRTVNALREYLIERLKQYNPHFQYIDDDSIRIELDKYIKEKEKELWLAKEKASLLLKVLYERDVNAENEYRKRFTSKEDLELLEKIIEKSKVDKKTVKTRWRGKIFSIIRNKYRELLLFPLEPQDVANIIYACVWRAQKKAEEEKKKGNPNYKQYYILDEGDIEYTVDRLYNEPHVTHIFRKSFAQNLRNQGVPLEVVAGYGVGWKDLSTLYLYYAKPAEAVVGEYFVKYVNILF